MYDVIEC